MSEPATMDMSTDAVNDLRERIEAALCDGGEEQFDIHTTHADKAERVYAVVASVLAERDGETSADDEAFVTELATSLVILITKWRERAGFVGAHERSAYTYDLCANELEAVLRGAT